MCAGTSGARAEHLPTDTTTDTERPSSPWFSVHVVLEPSWRVSPSAAPHVGTDARAVLEPHSPP